ncbi:MAG TPA: DUF72 domain-containing protein [Bryobacteraceae bacterium]|nr:DUF72 domain-containing protein [Bryobacteraceae bacterium]
MHSDWNAVVYPPVKPRGFHPLEHLSQLLDVVEIDCSFHRPLRPELSKLWIGKVAHNPKFMFTALLGRAFTYDRNLDADAVRSFNDGLRPLRASGKLGCLLMRFPWSFRFTRENRDFLIELRRSFHEFPLVAEMRHASWMLDEALGTLMDYRIGFCNVDQPDGVRAMPPDAIITSPVSYVRLLGRNGGDWTAEETAADYLYTPRELGCWQTRIERLRAHSSATFVVTANHSGGKAVVNALQLKSMLQETTAPPRRRPSLPPRRENLVPMLLRA